MICPLCDEPVTPDDAISATNLNDRSVHQECLFRLVAGSAAHILRDCPCYGGTRHDPPGVTKREAARLALEAYRTLHGTAAE